MTRLNISRPTSSVPKMWSALGGFSRSGTLTVSGSWIGRTGARNPRTSQVSTTRKPATATGFRLSVRNASPIGVRRVRLARLSVLAPARAVTVAKLPLSSGLRDADARVKDAVEDIDDKVDQDVGDGNDEGHAKEPRIVEF